MTHIKNRTTLLLTIEQTQTYRLTIKTSNRILTGVKWNGECTCFVLMFLDILYTKK